MADPEYPSCVSATVCVAASLFHSQAFKGSVWGPLVSNNSLPSTEQHALSCVSESYCVGLFATGDANGSPVAVAYYDGSSWSDRSVIGYPATFDPLVCRTDLLRYRWAVRDGRHPLKR